MLIYQVKRLIKTKDRKYSLGEKEYKNLQYLDGTE